MNYQPAIGQRVRVIDYRRIHKGLVGRVRQLSREKVIVDFEGKDEGSGVFDPPELEEVPEDENKK